MIVKNPLIHLTKMFPARSILIPILWILIFIIFNVLYVFQLIFLGKPPSLISFFMLVAVSLYLTLKILKKKFTHKYFFKVFSPVFVILLTIQFVKPLGTELLDPIFSFYIVHDTHYAPGYSHRGFEEIKTGMTLDEVEKLIGKSYCHYKETPRYDTFCPHPEDDNEIVLHWSLSPGDTNFMRKTVYINKKTGKVKKKESEFYID